MALSDELDAIASAPPTLDEVLAELDEPDRKALRLALEDVRKPATHIAKVLSLNGFPTSEGSIRRWRQAHQ